jgi:flavin reductase ActVB
MQTTRPTPAAADAAGVSSQVFREVMSHLAGGVVLVTSRVGGRPWGLTVTACCAISAEPPLVAVSIQSRTVTARSIVDQQAFEINLLSADQQELAAHGSAAGTPKFLDELLGEDGHRGGALATLECSLVRTVELNDHTLMIGQVEVVVPGTAVQPLVYWQRQYVSVS